MYTYAYAYVCQPYVHGGYTYYNINTLVIYIMIDVTIKKSRAPARAPARARARARAEYVHDRRQGDNHMPAADVLDTLEENRLASECGSSRSVD